MVFKKANSVQHPGGYVLIPEEEFLEAQAQR